LEKAVGIFEDKRKKTTEPEQEQLLANLYQQIGQQKVENDLLKHACNTG
jgi:hypothetical protein